MNKNIQIIKTSCVQLGLKSRSFFSNQFIPKSRYCLFQSAAFCRHWLLPASRKGLQLTRNEFLKIHQKKHWFKRCSKTMFENSVGLAMAILSTKVVQHFVEVREFSNLWGLLATRPVVTEATYETISFLIEFVIALMVFNLSEHFFEELRQKTDEQT